MALLGSQFEELLRKFAAFLGLRGATHSFSMAIFRYVVLEVVRAQRSACRVMTVDGSVRLLPNLR